MLDGEAADRIRAAAEEGCGDLRSGRGCETAAVSRRLLVPLGVLVTALLVVAALASRGRPLGGGGYGGGPTAGFFDYVFTSVVILAVAVLAFAVWGSLTNRPDVQRRPRSRSRYLASLLFLLGCAAVAWALSTNGFQRRLHGAEQKLAARTGSPRPGARTPQAPKAARNARIRWDEVAIVLALLAAAGVYAYSTRVRRRPLSTSRRASQAAVSAALDESLDDLRAEPDLRKAIVAAYARMERALAVAGLPRRPAEAPLEYLERALGELETSAAAVRRLTDLFEWAKFSHHEPLPDMRDEAIDALVAVRDELRAPAEPVAA
jgi:Domain of unknown function (DUF4129)